jgi:hypothetical protein
MGLALLAHASMPLKFWDEAFLAATYLINPTPPNFFPMICLYKNSWAPHQIILSSVSSVASVGPTCIHTTPINLNFAPLVVSFLAIAICTRGSSVSISLKVTSIFLQMSSSMNQYSHLLPSTPPSVLVIHLMSYYSLGIMKLLIWLMSLLYLLCLF